MKTLQTRPYRRNGFTLLEAMLSTILAAMIAILILAAYNTTVKNGSVLLKKSERYAQLRYAMDLMQADLANFYRCPDWQYMLLEGQSGVSRQDESDRLVFHAMQERSTPAGVGWSGPWKIEYGLFSKIDGLSYIGKRCGSAAPEDSEGSEETVIKLAENILEFHLEYLDQEQWVNLWQKKDAFPTLIRITLVGQGEAPDAPPITISQVVSLAPLPVFAASASTSPSMESAANEIPANR